MRDAVIKRLCDAIGVPEGEAVVPILPAVLLAWSDGRVEPAEIEAVHKRAEGMGLSDAVVARVDELLERHPGPYFPHRVLHLLSAALERLPLEEREQWTNDAEDCAQSVAHAGGLLSRIFGISAQEREDLSRLADALERSQPAEIDQWLDRLVTVSALRVAGLPALAAAGARVQKTVHYEMHHGASVQALALQVEVPGWEPLVVACVEQFAEGGELGVDEVRAVLSDTAHRPRIERWIALRQTIATMAQPLVKDERLRLLDVLREEAGPQAHLHEVTLAEMADLEDQLARGVGWVTWLAGKVPELLIDRDHIRRTLAPGTVDFARKEVASVRVVRSDQRPVEGLAFPVLEIATKDGRVLRLATPEPTSEPATPAAYTWIGRFLPVLRDPRSIVLLDDGEDAPHWTVEMRSGILDQEPSPPMSEPLPPGRALVVPPWIWLRSCWALGANPEAAA